MCTHVLTNYIVYTITSNIVLILHNLIIFGIIIRGKLPAAGENFSKPPFLKAENWLVRIEIADPPREFHPPTEENPPPQVSKSLTPGKWGYLKNQNPPPQLWGGWKLWIWVQEKMK